MSVGEAGRQSMGFIYTEAAAASNWNWNAQSAISRLWNWSIQVSQLRVAAGNQEMLAGWLCDDDSESERRKGIQRAHATKECSFVGEGKAHFHPFGSSSFSSFFHHQYSIL